MTLQNRMHNVSVIGAGGKMGRGISLLLLGEMIRREVLEYSKTRTGKYTLNLIDTAAHSLNGLLGYLHNELTKFAEKNIEKLRYYYRNNSDLVDNSEIIEDFIYGGLAIARYSSVFEQAKDSQLVFEAIIEDEKIKVEAFGKLNKITHPDTYYFTNTSSIPIHVLDTNAKLEGRILGFHFYNPPAVQKLLEIIPGKNTKKELALLGMEIGKCLEKTIVESRDVAGFVGNGHFMRDVLYASSQVNTLSKEYGMLESVYMINKITQDFMIRPMGIFQLVDYVGIDVVHKILMVMGKYITDEKFSSDLISRFVDSKILGGQNPDGSQKDGIFKYEHNKPVALYSLDEKKYISFGEGNWTLVCNEKLGLLPSSHVPWKMLVKDKNKNEKLTKYFKELFTQKTLVTQLAKKYLLHSKEIAQKLVETKVARSFEDVNTVSEQGFFHVYGPWNEYY